MDVLQNQLERYRDKRVIRIPLIIQFLLKQKLKIKETTIPGTLIIDLIEVPIIKIMTDFEIKVYKEVMKIKKGEVATYKDIAIKVGKPKSARAVGNALHKNPDNKKVPCHRVVNSKGECSGSFAFGGKGVQEKMLKSEGIKFKNGKIIIKHGIN